MNAAKVADKVRGAFAALAELRAVDHAGAEAIARDADARHHAFTLGLGQEALVGMLAGIPNPIPQEK